MMDMKRIEDNLLTANINNNDLQKGEFIVGFPLSALDLIKKQQEQIERYEKALIFYAHPQTYKPDLSAQWEPVTQIDSDKGNMAQQALEDTP